MDTVLKEIAQAIQNQFGVEVQEFRDEMILVVPPDQIVAVVRALKGNHGFHMLCDETAVDYWPQIEPRFHIVYQLRNLQSRLLITLRTPLNGNDPHMETMTTVFPNANWFEREIWDMFGVTFDGHPDPRRILMPSDWQGHPLRKDYPLGYEEVQFTFNEREIMVRKPHPKE